RDRARARPAGVGPSLPDPDADGAGPDGEQDRGAGRRGRRLPDEALRLHRADGTAEGAAAEVGRRGGTDPEGGRCGAGSGDARGAAPWRAGDADAQGVRLARVSAPQRQPAPLAGHADGARPGAPARSGAERRGCLHQLSAQQAGPRTRADPDGPRGGLHGAGGRGGRMTRRGPSLRREILAWYSLVLIVALSLFSMAAYFLLQQALIRAETESLRQTAEAVEQVSIPQGIPRIDTQDEFVTFENALGDRVRAIRRRTALATGDVVEVVVAPPEDVESRVLRSFLLIARLLIPFTALAVALRAGILLERLLDPLRRLVETTREIGIGGLSRRVPEPDRPSDLQDLAQSFNGMLMRLERAVEALRHFTADASHELKT